ncbi:MAG: aldo/keto reductase [Pseudomonadota bacterium]
MADLVLGTVQIGQAYGIANTVGLPEETAALALLETALAKGLTLDTARAYGQSEHRIGLALSRYEASGNTPPPSLVTKIRPLDDLAGEADARRVVHAVNNSLQKSCFFLDTDGLGTVLLHRTADGMRANGAAWQRLRDLKEAGLMDRIGVSVQSPAELHSVLTLPELGHVQMPFNLLDHRWAEEGAIDALRARPDVTVHVRSVFLQGLLCGLPLTQWPAIDGALRDGLDGWLDEVLGAFGLPDRKSLALSFVRAQDWIDGIVIGCERVDQLEENIAAFDQPTLAMADFRAWLADRPRAPTALLDPAQWPPRPALGGSPSLKSSSQNSEAA